MSSLSEMQFRRVSVMQSEMELAQAHLRAAAREAWIELPESEPWRDQALFSRLNGLIGAIDGELKAIEPVRARVLKNWSLDQ